MTQTIEKVAETHTVDEMQKRDGETSMAVGLFILALGVPVSFATLLVDRSTTLGQHGAIVNAICGLVLLLIGGSAAGYGWILYQRAHNYK